MKSILVLFCTFLLLKCQLGFCQQKQEPATGKLFIIGGGDRSAELIKTLVSTAQLNSKDYIVVLPMSEENQTHLFIILKFNWRRLVTISLPILILQRRESMTSCGLIR